MQPAERYIHVSWRGVAGSGFVIPYHCVNVDRTHAQSSKRQSCMCLCMRAITIRFVCWIRLVGFALFRIYTTYM